MKQILCFGDSNTYGLIPGTKDRYPWEVRWTGILAEGIREKGFQVVEEGLCGRTTVFEDELRDNRRGAAVLPMILESHQPLEKVVLMLGTNDCKTIYQASAEVIGKGVEKLVHQIQAADENIEILLVSPILLGEGVGEEGYDPEFNQESVETSKGLKAVYEQVAKRNGCAFLAASDYAKASGADREHLDENGHRQLAEAVLQRIA
ncbi:MAG: arylesterase [Clostridiales bacterium]|nr:arylesterase [Clostridiales bacterium]